jgi:hypothetical protein
MPELYWECRDIGRELSLTPGAVRSAVRSGRIACVKATLRGCHLWTEDEASEVISLEQLRRRRRSAWHPPRQMNLRIERRGFSSDSRSH